MCVSAGRDPCRHVRRHPGRATAAKAIAGQLKFTKGLALDVGCGDGSPALELAKLTELRFHGVESAPTAVDRACKAVDSAGVYGTRVTISRGDLARPGGELTGAVLAEGMVFVGSTARKLIALDAGSGKVQCLARGPARQNRLPWAVSSLRAMRRFLCSAEYAVDAALRPFGGSGWRTNLRQPPNTSLVAPEGRAVSNLMPLDLLFPNRFEPLTART